MYRAPCFLRIVVLLWHAKEKRGQRILARLILRGRNPALGDSEAFRLFFVSNEIVAEDVLKHMKRFAERGRVADVYRQAFTHLLGYRVLKQPIRRCAQCVAEREERSGAGLSDALFEVADVVRRKAGSVSKLLLRQPAFYPDALKLSAKAD